MAKVCPQRKQLYSVTFSFCTVIKLTLTRSFFRVSWNHCYFLPSDNQISGIVAALSLEVLVDEGRPFSIYWYSDDLKYMMVAVDSSILNISIQIGIFDSCAVKLDTWKCHVSAYVYVKKKSTVSTWHVFPNTAEEYVSRKIWVKKTGMRSQKATVWGLFLSSHFWRIFKSFWHLKKWVASSGEDRLRNFRGKKTRVSCEFWWGLLEKFPWKKRTSIYTD